MLELARCFGEGPVRMSVLAENQSLSPKYLHTLLTTLKAAGLVRSVRGPGGGFVLTRAPAWIKLRDVLHAVEGPLSLVDCVADEHVCDRSRGCPARRVWEDLSSAIDRALDKVSLASLLAPKAYARYKPEGTKKSPGARRRPQGSKQSRATSPRRRTEADKK